MCAYSDFLESYYSGGFYELYKCKLQVSKCKEISLTRTQSKQKFNNNNPTPASMGGGFCSWLESVFYNKLF